jgi:hypothetical protein
VAGCALSLALPAPVAAVETSTTPETIAMADGCEPSPATGGMAAPRADIASRTGGAVACPGPEAEPVDGPARVVVAATPRASKAQSPDAATPGTGGNSTAGMEALPTAARAPGAQAAGGSSEPVGVRAGHETDSNASGGTLGKLPVTGFQAMLLGIAGASLLAAALLARRTFAG